MGKVEWLRKYIDEIKCRSNGKQVYIYGAGRAGKIIKVICDNNNIEVKGFVVTNKDIAVKDKEGLPVMQFDQMREHWGKMFILIGVKEWGEHTVENYLRSLGFEDYIPVPENILDLDKLHNAKKRRPSVGVTPIIGCSVNCRYCPQKLLVSKYFEKDKKRKSHMTLEDFKVCMSHMPQETIVEFSGFVEPFLNKEAIDMMEYTAEIGRDMTLYTTLVGMDNDVLKRVIKLPFKKVILHTADMDGYANIPVTDQYLYLLESVINAKKEDGSLFVDSANCQSTPDEAVLQITKGKVNNYFELHDRAGNLEESKEQGIKHFEKHGLIYCSIGEDLNNFVLLPDGTVVLCCMDFGMQHVMGNLHTDTYEDIINGEAMRNLKRAMRTENSFSCICRKCLYAIEEDGQ